jgi:hypothetical protein
MQEVRFWRTAEIAFCLHDMQYLHYVHKQFIVETTESHMMKKAVILLMNRIEYINKVWT